MGQGSAADPNEIIRQVAERGLGIKFGRGVAAKTAYAMCALLVIIWGGVIWKLGDSIVQNCFLVGSASVASALTVWWICSTQRFAERNPAQAILDGAQFIEYKRFEAQAKGSPPVSGTSLIEAGSNTALPRTAD